MIAYFILIHRYPEQFKRLFKVIYDPTQYYVIHVDKRAGGAFHRDIEHFLSAYPNTALLKSQNALWGGYSLVEAELRGMEMLLKMGKTWEFFINLSGQDFPLVSQANIRKFLEKNTGKDFLKVSNQQEKRPSTIPRLDYYYLELAKKVIRTPLKRLFLSDVTPYIGNQWMILSRRFCEFLCTSREVDRFKRFYRHTFIADEGFFQTVIMNTSYKSTIVNDDLRAIDWVPEGEIKLRPRTFTLADGPSLVASENLFARKFDATVDEKILDYLEAHLERS